ncbi:MAG: heme-binding protein [Alphaproteobacteria bacterium]|uniref:GlcG/HbpS family heme-binding protein n=1 Tax=Pacificispira sp. TaxID=2888761 RepID=UPI001B28F05F|nr:heme-binding protein [Alphaproteobacteria bacterium]MBO6864291.1 heme-binding protein [Alphaproteobacteria bacterium]MEC9264760.1 heme-binding protein [Pseudomonadota bacterium]
MSMRSVTLAQARIIIDQALSAPRSSPDRRLAVAVCDAGGHLLAFEREGGAPPLLGHIAQAKAQTCIAYGKSTADLMDMAEQWPVWFEGISRVSMERMGLPLIATRGGVFIRDTDGSVMGAVGVAGEAGEYDEANAIAGIRSAGLAADAD